jgi:hypothetical protein
MDIEGEWFLGIWQVEGRGLASAEEITFENLIIDLNIFECLLWTRHFARRW